MSTDLVLNSEMLVKMEESRALTAVACDLSMRPDLSLDQFEAICVYVGRFASACKWWIGDLVNQGELRYGENVYQALEGLNMSPEGRQECARVAAAIPRSRRRPSLSWSHHRAVARRSITPAEREELLDQAEREKWGGREIEAAVRARRDDRKLHVKDLKDCDQLAESAACNLREALVSCGYPPDISVSIEIAAPGIAFTTAARAA